MPVLISSTWLTLFTIYFCRSRGWAFDQRYLHGLLDSAELRSAKVTGLAMRPAYTFSGGVISLLEQTAFRRESDRLKLELTGHADVLVGDVVQSRLRSLAQELG